MTTDIFHINKDIQVYFTWAVIYKYISCEQWHIFHTSSDIHIYFTWAMTRFTWVWHTYILHMSNDIHIYFTWAMTYIYTSHEQWHTYILHMSKTYTYTSYEHWHTHDFISVMIFVSLFYISSTQWPVNNDVHIILHLQWHDVDFT